MKMKKIKIIAFAILILKIHLCDTNFMQWGGVQCKELNASHGHIKGVNKFYYTEKDGIAKWPCIAVYRKALITIIQVAQ